MKSQRIIVLFTLIFAGFIALILRAGQLQLFPDFRLKELKTKQFETTVTLRSRRGAMFDRTGKELAVSIRADSLFADPSLIENPKAVARKLAPLLKMERDDLHSKIKDSGKRFVWLQRQMDAKLVQQIRDLKVRGLGFIEEAVRVYPNGPLAAGTLGFVSRDGQGLGGLESRYNQELEGTTKKISLPRDARGRPLLRSGHVLSENLDGSDLELTIDQELQFVLERELQAAVRKNSAHGAWGIVLDPETGEILAMAQEPGFNPNRAHDFNAVDRKNRLVADVYEPASVVKPLVAAIALDKGLIAANSKFDCENGKLTIGGRVIREAEAKEKFGWLSVSEILAFSSNVGIVKIANLMSPEMVRDGLLYFGLGERTNIDLFGESRGILHSLPWRPHQFATTSFGHGISTTAIQLAMAYGAISNGGLLLQPYLVRSVREVSTGKIQHKHRHVVRRVISKETSDKMRMLLTTATAPGATGFKARVAGYPIAGKTGTAQKADLEKGGYKSGSYIASFAGIAPAHDPRFVIYIAVDEPQKDYYGAGVAAPVFAKVAAFALRQHRVPPVLISESDVLSSGNGDSKLAKARLPAVDPSEREYGTGLMPDLIGLAARDALRRLQADGMDVKVVGDGRVQDTWPQPSQSLPRSKHVTIFLR